MRKIGRLLDVPEQFIKRHPFPGPGLAVRVLGDVTEGDRLDVLREVNCGTVWNVDCTSLMCDILICDAAIRRMRYMSSLSGSYITDV